MTKDTLPPPAVLAAPEPPASTDDYDSPWKEAIETCFPEFLAFYFPRVHTAIDWQHTPVFLDKELRATVRDAESGKLYVDKLVRVVGRSGRSLCLYIHIEIQGTRQRIFAERMFVYHYRLFDRYLAPVVSLAPHQQAGTPQFDGGDKQYSKNLTSAHCLSLSMNV